MAQVHLPNDNLARGAPWHETRRQIHQKSTARWSAVSSLPYRSTHTIAAGSSSSATESEDGQEADPAPQGNTPTAAVELQSKAADEDSEASKTLSYKSMRLARFSKRKRRDGLVTQPIAMPASPADPQTQGVTQPYAVTPEDTDLETISVEQIESEQREQELQRLRMRAERAKAREQAKKELERQKEEEKKQREKERLKARPDWAAQKAALKEKFPEGWRPRKKLSPDALNGIRALNKQFPDTYTTEVLANKFEVSPEAIRRILRSKWEASPEEEEDRERRWHNRGVNIWQHYAAIGKKPPAKWRDAGVAVPSRRGRDRQRDEPELDSFSGYDDPVEQDDTVELERIKRFKRQQKLAKQLL